MQLSEIRTNIRDITDETDTTQLTDAVLNVFINTRYHELVSKLMTAFEDYFGTSDNTIDLVTDQVEYDLPVDANSRCEVMKVKRVEIAYDGSDYNLAYPFDMNDKWTTESDTQGQYTQEEPHYYLYGNKIGFDPKPTSNQSNAVKLWYIARQADLSNDTDKPAIPDEYHQLIVYGASADVKKRDDNFNAARNYEMDYKEGVREMINELKKRQIQAPKMVKSPNDKPLDPADVAEAGSLS